MMSRLLDDLRTGRDVHLWQRRLDLQAVPSAADLGVLSDGERRRAARFRRQEDRCRYVQRHHHLRRVLAAYLGGAAEDVPLDTSLHVQPRLIDGDLAPDLRISLSSSADRSIVAVAWRRAVGVDIEAITPEVDVEALATSVFSPGECKALMATPAGGRRALFFRIWTRKEAFVKALGSGLSRDLASFDVVAEDRLGASEEPVTVVDREAQGGDPIWHVSDIAAPDGFRIACCAEGEGWAIVFNENDA